MKNKITRLINNDIFNTLLFRGLGAAFAFSTSVIIARMYGAEYKGQLVYIMSIAAMFSIGYLTFQHSIIALSKRYEKNQLISVSFIFFVILSIANLLIFYILLKSNLISAKEEYIYSIFFFIPLVYFQVLASSYYQLLNKLIKFNYIQLYSKLLILIVISVLAMKQLEFDMVIKTYLMFMAFFSLYIIYSLRKTLQFTFDVEIVKSLLKASFIIHLSTIGTLLLGQYNNYYIGLHFNFESLGYYDASSQIYGIVILIASSIVPVIYSRGLHYSKKEFSNFMTKLLMYVTALTSVLAIIFSFFSENIIELIYGKSFLPSSEILKYQMFLICIQVLILLLAPLWILNNKLKETSFIMISISILYFILIHIIMPKDIIELIKILILTSSLLATINIFYSYKVLFKHIKEEE